MVPPGRVEEPWLRQLWRKASQPTSPDHGSPQYLTIVNGQIRQRGNGTLTFDTRFLASRAVAGTYAMWGNNGLGRRATELTSSQAPAGILDVRRKPAQSSQF